MEQIKYLFTQPLENKLRARLHYWNTLEYAAVLLKSIYSCGSHMTFESLCAFPWNNFYSHVFKRRGKEVPKLHHSSQLLPGNSGSPALKHRWQMALQPPICKSSPSQAVHSIVEQFLLLSQNLLFYWFESYPLEPGKTNLLHHPCDILSDI